MRRFGETLKNFTQCLKWASEGKRFIYVHPDFVALDTKTWQQIQKELHPPLNRQIVYDECGEWNPEKEKLLKKILKERLKK
jgi:hypothetical protein